VDDGRLVPEHPRRPDGDHARLTFRILAWAVDIRVAQNGVFNVIVFPIDVQIVLDLVLAGTVRVQRIDGMVLIYGEVLRLTIHGAPRRGIHHFTGAASAGLLKKVHRANDIDLSIEPWPHHRLAHIRLGGLM